MITIVVVGLSVPFLRKSVRPLLEELRHVAPQTRRRVDLGY